MPLINEDYVRIAMLAHLLDALKMYSVVEGPDGTKEKKHWSDDLPVVDEDKQIVEIKLKIPMLDLAYWIEANARTSFEMIVPAHVWRDRLPSFAPVDSEGII